MIILAYHLVRRYSDHEMVVSEADFVSQLRWLGERGYDLSTRWKRDDFLKPTEPGMRRALVSFDDGYKNTLQTAAPLLNEFGASALLAVCGSYMFRHSRSAPTIHHSQEFCDPEDILSWCDLGHGVASHSFSHPRLDQLEEAAVEAELMADKLILAEVLGRAPEFFIYPFGKHKSQTVEAVGRHYEVALSVDSGSWIANCCPLAVNRVLPRGLWSMDHFKSEIRRVEGIVAKG